MTMTRSKRRLPARQICLAAAAGFTALLVACGGGGGGGDSGTPAAPAATTTATTFSGPISGFGSIFVNGVRIDNSAASITLDDDNPGGRDDDLRLGMVVEVQGQRDNAGATGRATSIASRSFVQGPVSTVNAGAGTLTVFGVRITVTPSTVFDGSGLSGLAALAPNDIVEVHGLPDATGASLKATRIERKAAGSEARLTGIVQNAAASTFTINGITVQFTPGVLANLPGGVVNGATVRVKGTLATPTVIAATRVRGTSLVPAIVAGQRAELEGAITRFTSATDFEVSGLRVTVPATAVVSGTPVLGARVEVKGTVAGGVLSATQLEVEDEAHEASEANELHAVVASIDKASLTLTLRSGTLAVQWSSATAFDAATLPRGAESLLVGQRLEVRGKVAGNVVLASRIKVDN